VQSYTRHKLKQDKFQEAAKGTVHWTVVHRKTIVTTVVAAVIVAVVAISLVAYNSRQQERASEAIGGALRTYNAPLRQPNIAVDPKTQTFLSAEERAKEANKQFKQVADKYPHTGAGKNARYLAAITTMESGDNAAAERQLREIGDSGDPEHASLAKLTLANLYRSSSRDADAVRLYKDLIDHPTGAVPKAAAQFELASAYESKQPAEAKRIYDELAKDPSPMIAQIAKQRLAGLGQ
jgi:predicted negative regulator of RcsB-dependent stress response